MSEDSPTVRAGTILCEKTRKLKILKSLHKLIHACKCTTPTCDEQGCEEMKILVVHFKVCSKKDNRKDCHLCGQLLALCLYHAKNSKDCEGVHCAVPYCAKIKSKLDSKNGVLPQKAQLRHLEPDVDDGASIWSSSSSEFDWGLNTSDNHDDDVETLEPPLDLSLNEDEQSLTQWMDFQLPTPQIPTNPQNQPVALELEPTYPATSQENQPLVQIPDPEPAHSGNNLDAANNSHSTLLAKLLHSQQCLSEEERGVARWPCFETDCGVMKNVIRHISQCHLDGECTRIHCSTAKFLLNHSRNCRDISCTYCRPVRPTHVVSSVCSSWAPVPAHWKSEISPGIRQEVVYYAVAVLISAFKQYKDSMNVFVKKIEDHAFRTCTTKAEYCEFIASRVPSFDMKLCGDIYKDAKLKLLGIIEAVLSPNPAFKQIRILEFYEANGHQQALTTGRL